MIRSNRISAAVALMTILVSTPLAASGVRAVPDDAKDIKPIQVGQSLPEITLKAPDGTQFDLNAAVGSSPTILIFFRGGWCPYCNTHLGAIQTVEPKLIELGYQIIAVSADRPEILGAPVEKNRLEFAVYSDNEMIAAEALGIAFRVDDATVERYRGHNIDLEADSGKTHHILPVPAAFVLDTSGTVLYSYVNPNYKIRIDPDVLLEAAEAALKK